MRFAAPDRPFFFFLDLRAAFGRRAAALAAILAAGAAPAAAQAPEASPLKLFRDWVVGCDNLRGCVALGLGPRPDVGSGAYLRVVRSGAPEEKPQVSIALASDGGGASPAFILTLDGKTLSPGRKQAVPAKLPARRDGDFLTATLGEAQAQAFLDALREGSGLDVTLAGKPKKGPPQQARISLDGAAAALRYMDAAQGRAGTVTALVARGEAPVPDAPAPAEPQVAAARMRLLSPPPSLPKSLKPSGEESCASYDPIAIALSPTQTLWGLCAYAAAYNFAYRFWIVGPEGARPAEFPGGDREEPSLLTNPGLTRDGLVLAAREKGRGVGDCGESGRWAFDGAAFRLVLKQRMDECRGVAPDDWPVLFRAAVRPL